jgi:hypothetical protein
MFAGMPLSARQATAPLAAILIVAVLATSGCLPSPHAPAGSRQLVITVTNDSPVPAILEVAPMGLGGVGVPIGQARWVGVAQPASVARGEQAVTFFVPPGNDWAIYANGGELIGPLDVGSHVGVLPIGIVIDRNGNPGWTSPGNWP